MSQATDDNPSPYPAGNTGHKCECSWCQFNRRVDDVVRHGNRDALVALIREMQEGSLDTLEDLAYRKAILDGSWPSAEQILEHALVKIRNKQTAQQQQLAEAPRG